MTDRRDFVKGSLALGFAAVMTGRAGARPSSSPFPIPHSPNLRVGILADTHIRLHPAAVAWTKKFEAALRRFDAEKVDAVLVAGDLTDFGLAPELKAFADIWYKVFPDDRRSDGAHVEKLFIYGDHDTQEIYKRLKPGLNGYPFSAEEIAKMAIINNDRAALWRECFREDWSPVVKKTVKGCDFVLVHHAWGEPDNKWGSRAPAMKPFYENYRPDSSRPFFHVQHRVCRNTVYWPEPAPATFDDGSSTEILSRFSNCFAFCGHGHKFFNNERTMWQGAFTCCEIPGLSYVSVFAGRENCAFSDAQKKAAEAAGRVPQMKAVPGGGAGWSEAQGMIMDVLGDKIVLHRIDFETPAPELFGPDWVVPLPLGKEKPFDFAVMEARLDVPQFPKGAKVEIKNTTGKNRKGEETEQFVVSFPTALASAAGPRAFDYEVAVAGKDGTKVVKRVYSPKYWRAESAEPKTSECVFAKSELPKGKIRFAVRPANSFGKAGKAIGCEWRAKM